MLSYTSCRLCPRQCGVDRTRGQVGFCRMPDTMQAARAAAHYWEEPVISGNFGTGAVFFSGCTLGCQFCQNTPISRENFGTALSTAHLREVLEDLVDQGVESLSLVTPTHFLPSILPALTPKLPVPLVYNCGGYESVETLRELEGLVDVYLPDMKYSDDTLAARLSQAPDYVAVATAAILEMYRQTGPVQTADGLLKRGVLIRHLILPGQLDNSLGVVQWLQEHFPRGAVLFSLMSQYIPAGPLAHTPPFDRPISQTEYDAVVSWMELLGIRSGFLQEFSSASQVYVPDFHLQGLVD